MRKENIIYGLRPVMEAIASGREIERLFIQTGLKGSLYHQLIQMAQESNTPYQYVPTGRLNRLTTGNHQGVVCLLSAIVYHPVESLVPALYEQGKPPFLLILDRITDIRNFGAIVRTAEGAGVDGIVISAKGSAQINADAVKTSAGALLNMPVHRSLNMHNTLVYLKNSGLHIIAATEKALQPYHVPDYTVPVAIIMGSEEKGISKELLKLADSMVAIPLRGKIQSLNVAVAAGIIMFEVVKQRLAYDEENRSK
jgi:23S rRNA (guanosine2251-2'-O)-methyltransferase